MSIRQVIHVRYNDLTALTEELEALFPERNFVIDVRFANAEGWESSLVTDSDLVCTQCEMGQIVLTMPRELTQVSLPSMFL